MTSTSPCSSPSDRQNTDEDVEGESADNDDLPFLAMCEFTYTHESPDDNDAKDWAHICNRIKPFEWCDIKTSSNWDLEHCWRKIDTCQCRGRDHHIFKHQTGFRKPMMVIVRQIAPDLHVNIETANQERIVQFVYTMSGNLICELDTDTVAEVMPYRFEMEDFIRNHLGLTDQQNVFLHITATVADILNDKQNKTTTHSTNC